MIRELPCWSRLTWLGLLLLMCISLRNYPFHWGLQIYLNWKYTNVFKFKFLMFNNIFLTCLFWILMLFSVFFFINLTANSRFVLNTIYSSWMQKNLLYLTYDNLLLLFNSEIHEHLSGNLWICFYCLIVQRRKKIWIKEISNFRK